MISLEQGIISPSRKEDGAYFEDLREKAFEGSEYEDYYEDDEFKWYYLLIPVTAIAFALGLASFINKKKNNNLLNAKDLDLRDVGYYRDIPLDGFIPAVYYLGSVKKKFSKDNVLAAYLLKWIHQGALEPMKEDQVRRLGFFKKKKIGTSLSIKTRPELEKSFENELWSYLVRAAGRDKLLEEYEFQNYIKGDPEEFQDILDMIVDDGIDYSEEKDLISFVKQGFFNKKYRLNDQGFEEMKNLFGLYNYLKDFTIIEERSVKEVSLWDQYLILATVFGFGETVLKELRKLYPKNVYITRPEAETGLDQMDIFLMTRHMSSTSMRTLNSSLARQAARGGGGFSSIGGGGGSVGGGSGGGAR